MSKTLMRPISAALLAPVIAGVIMSLILGLPGAMRRAPIENVEWALLPVMFLVLAIGVAALLLPFTIGATLLAVKLDKHLPLWALVIAGLAYGALVGLVHKSVRADVEAGFLVAILLWWLGFYRRRVV